MPLARPGGSAAPHVSSPIKGGKPGGNSAPASGAPTPGFKAPGAPRNPKPPAK